MGGLVARQMDSHDRTNTSVFIEWESKRPHLMAQFQFSLTTDFQFSAPSLPLSSTFHQRMWKISRFHHKRTTLPVLLHFWSLAAWSSTAESDLGFHGRVQWGSYGTDLAWLPPDLHAAQTTGSRSFHHLKMSTPARKALMSEAWVAGRGRGKTGSKAATTVHLIFTRYVSCTISVFITNGGSVWWWSFRLWMGRFLW